jgi:hypothetical protein
LEPLTAALKLPRSSLSLAIKLFGKTDPDMMLSVIDNIVEALGSPVRIMNTCKGLAGLLAGYLDKFDITLESKSKSGITRSNGPILIGD